MHSDKFNPYKIGYYEKHGRSRVIKECCLRSRKSYRRKWNASLDYCLSFKSITLEEIEEKIPIYYWN